MTTMELLTQAKGAKAAMALADTDTKNKALLAMAGALEAHTADILSANALDLEGARGTISEVMLDRLALSESRIAGMARGIREVAALPDPVGEVLARVERPNGLVIERTAVPLGVIAILYESRPIVTADAAAGYDALALGCPAIGAEVLEEAEFEPFFSALEGKLSGKKVGLFGSYGWGDGQWMRDWYDRTASAGASLVGGEGVMANEAPDEAALAACKELGAALAG